MIAGACGRFFIFQFGSVAIITASSYKYGKRFETNSPEQCKEGQRVTSFRLHDRMKNQGKTTH